MKIPSLSLWVFGLLLLLTSCAPKPDDTPLYQGQEWNPKQQLEIIAIGSCNKQSSEQHIWKVVEAQEPDLWIWLGDNIYGDTEDMQVMLAKYQQQKGHPEYQTFRTNTPVIGTWDDHDFGVNDGGKEYAKKEESSQLMFDFLDVAQDEPARKRAGVYQSYVVGPDGQQVKIILLDTRWFRDPLVAASGNEQRYEPNLTGDILGEAQWSWLEEELTNSNAQIHLIGTSIQLIPEEQYFEKWANFPTARKRFFELLEKTRPARPILMSGDRHIAELSKIELDSLATPLYEITASGMTHTWKPAWGTDEPNQHRVSDLIIAKNFGLIHIDWSQPEPVITVRILDEEGKERLKHTLS